MHFLRKILGLKTKTVTELKVGSWYVWNTWPEGEPVQLTSVDPRRGKNKGRYTARFNFTINQGERTLTGALNFTVAEDKITWGEPKNNYLRHYGLLDWLLHR